MNRRSILWLLTAAALTAQTGRDSYRASYQAWRQLAPALEQEAAAPTANFVSQAQSSAQAAQAFFDARQKSYTTGLLTPEQKARLNQPLVRGAALLETPAEVQQLVAVMSARVATTITSFANDPDPAIRQVRQAMERERAALRALTESISARKTLVAELNAAVDQAEQQRSAAATALAAAEARRGQLAGALQREAAGWAEYYKDLEESVSSSSRTSSVAPPPSPVKPSTPAAAGALPLSRYTGEWLFPSRGLFYGPQPETVELVVRESGGQLIGTLDARFIGNITLRLDFQGPVQPSRTQTLRAQSADGAQGTIELIPGSAFNLLEINLQTTARPGSGNFILLRR